MDFTSPNSKEPKEKTKRFTDKDPSTRVRSKNAALHPKKSKSSKTVSGTGGGLSSQSKHRKAKSSTGPSLLNMEYFCRIINEPSTLIFRLPTTSKRFPCLICNDYVGSLKHMINHSKTEHRTHMIQYQCRTCDEIFISRATVYKHFVTKHPKVVENNEEKELSDKLNASLTSGRVESWTTSHNNTFETIENICHQLSEYSKSPQGDSTKPKSPKGRRRKVIQEKQITEPSLTNTFLVPFGESWNVCNLCPDKIYESLGCKVRHLQKMHKFMTVWFQCRFCMVISSSLKSVRHHIQASHPGKPYDFMPSSSTSSATPLLTPSQNSASINEATSCHSNKSKEVEKTSFSSPAGKGLARSKSKTTVPPSKITKSSSLAVPGNRNVLNFKALPSQLEHFCIYDPGSPRCLVLKLPTTSRKMSCPVCGEHLLSLKNMMSHAETIHMDHVVRYQCCLCDKIYISIKTFNSHVLKEHPKDIKYDVTSEPDDDDVINDPDDDVTNEPDDDDDVVTKKPDEESNVLLTLHADSTQPSSLIPDNAIAVSSCHQSESISEVPTSDDTPTPELFPTSSHTDDISQAKSTNLKGTILVPFDELWRTCDFCEVKFIYSNLSGKVRHLQRNHKCTSIEYKCRFCTESFGKCKHARQHIKTNHPGQPFDFLSSSSQLPQPEKDAGHSKNPNLRKKKTNISRSVSKDSCSRVGSRSKTTAPQSDITESSLQAVPDSTTVPSSCDLQEGISESSARSHLPKPEQFYRLINDPDSKSPLRLILWLPTTYQKILCPICKKDGYSIKKLIDHIHTAHINYTIQYQCRVCNEMFNARPTAYKHLETMHSKVVKYGTANKPAVISNIFSTLRTQEPPSSLPDNDIGVSSCRQSESISEISTSDNMLTQEIFPISHADGMQAAASIPQTKHTNLKVTFLLPLDESWNICDLCEVPVTFANIEGKRRHLQSNHNCTSFIFQCRFCASSFDQLKHVRCHIEKSHPDKPVVFRPISSLTSIPALDQNLSQSSTSSSSSAVTFPDETPFQESISIPSKKRKASSISSLSSGDDDDGCLRPLKKSNRRKSQIENNSDILDEVSSALDMFSDCSSSINEDEAIVDDVNEIFDELSNASSEF